MYKILLGLIFVSISFAASKIPETMVFIEGGTYTPLYGTDSLPVKVESFRIDIYPVTNSQYLEFVNQNPTWKKGNAKLLLADELYLKDWESPNTLGAKAPMNSPVTNVSWYSARAYCACQGKTLPSINEWEVVAMASEKNKDARQEESYNAKILEWYGKPTQKPLRAVGSNKPNYWGVYDLHDLVWEWTLDFNSVLISGESRKDGDVDRNLFCSGGAIGATDLMNYAAFLRYAFRGSLKANYTTSNLGFRCIKK